MSDALVYNIPAWSKEIDPIFANAACDKTMLFPDQHLSPDLYTRRMSDSGLSADTGTTTDPDSPATDPASASPDHAQSRKPSLPGIDALTPLLDPADPFPRRASLPTLASDLSLRSPGPTLSRATFRGPGQPLTAVPRAYGDHPLSAYSFPPTSASTPPYLGHTHSNSDPEHAQRPRLDASYQYVPGFGGQNSASTSASGTSFPSPFTSPLSPDYQAQTLPRSHSATSLNRDESTFDPLAHTNSPMYASGRWPEQQQWGTNSPTEPPPSASASPPSRARSTPKRRRSPATPPAPAQPAPSAAQSQPQQQDGQPQRRPRGKLPKHTTDLLKEWLHAHSDHPYPSEDEKRDLCARTKLSMSQVSNWMINARRRILAPAKHPTVAATTTEPYRTSHPRPIGSLYPTHHPHASPHHLYPPPGIVRRVSENDSLRLYEPAYAQGQQEYGARYQAQAYGASPAQAMYDRGHGPGAERRLAYPASTVGLPSSYGAGEPYSPQYAPPLFLPNPGGQQQREAAPRYFAAPPDGGL